MRLSFHDHPPLVFLAQNFSMRAFGQTPFAVRLPSVLSGLAAVWLVYLIGKNLYSPLVGLTGATLFAFTVNHVWISRIGLQESILIVLMLASAFCFFKFSGLILPSSSVTIGRPIVTDEKNQNWLWLIAAAFFLGLAFLAKYIALILAPIFASIFILYQVMNKARRLYSRRVFLQISIAVFLFLAVASPIIIYNIQLYRNFGHFDFQFSLLARQNVPEWQDRPGQEVLGSFANRLKTYFPRLLEANSPYFLILAAIGFAIILAQMIFRRRFSAYSPFAVSHAFLVITLAWLLPFLIFIGPAHRFFTILTPWLAISAGYALIVMSNNFPFYYRGLTSIVIALTLAVEILYSYNSVVALDPVGLRPWSYSYLHRQSLSSGFNQLNLYFDEELKGKMPDTAITFEFPFARELLKQATDSGRSQNLQAVPWGIVYNDNINLSAQRWVLLRRITYHGWPVASAENFIAGGGQKFFIESGIKKIYFINPTVLALQDRTRPPTAHGDIMESQLRARGFKPAEEIKNPRGEISFRVYKFNLQ